MSVGGGTSLQNSWKDLLRIDSSDSRVSSLYLKDRDIKQLLSHAPVNGA